MQYEPAKICCLFEKKYNRLTGKLISQTDLYFQVRTRSIGNCGHRHKTEQGALAEPPKEEKP